MYLIQTSSVVHVDFDNAGNVSLNHYSLEQWLTIKLVSTLNHLMPPKNVCEDFARSSHLNLNQCSPFFWKAMEV